MTPSPRCCYSCGRSFVGAEGAVRAPHDPDRCLDCVQKAVELFCDSIPLSLIPPDPQDDEEIR